MPGATSAPTDGLAATNPSQGLSTLEAERRQRAYGPNETATGKSRAGLAVLVEAMREPMLILIFAAAVLYLALGDLAEGVFLMAGALVSAGLVVTQAMRSERALKALRELAQPRARVVRQGREETIPSRGLTVGDIMLVDEGERLTADAVLVDGDVLRIDESALTGESAPVLKRPRPLSDPSAGAAPDAARQLWSGSLIVGGQGIAQVTAVGPATAFGQLGASLAAIEQEPTPLQKSAGRLVRLLGLLAVGFCGVVVLAYGLARGDWLEAALAGITMAIAMIPEEFPMVLTVFLGLGAFRLARSKVLVRRPAAIEALGGATVLCVDKTGTLTQNRMQVACLQSEGTTWWSQLGGPVPRGVFDALAEAASLASAIRPVDPMDRAIRQLGPGPTETLVKAWPLRPERLAVVQLWHRTDGLVAAAKGAPETIFQLCRLSSEDQVRLHAAVATLAAKGLRVLGVATWRGDGDFPADPSQALFTFAGLIGFIDPLRPDAAPALAAANSAGVKVVMITGDYPATALAIAREAGIDVSGGAVSGAELDALSDEALRSRATKVRVFARIRPEQKLRLVEAFKASGEVVAMTGDGVNDAPALEAAHIGIAMGERGTEVAREAADLVLLDDSFASIVAGVRLGRRIFANLRKALTYITAVHVPIAGLALLPILVGLPPMLLPMHVVLMELVVDPVCSLVFEAERSEARAMARPPRRREESLFGVRQLALALFQGGVVLAAVFGFYLWVQQSQAQEVARGAAFTALIIGNLSLALADSAEPGERLFSRSRVAFWAIGGLALTVLAGALYVPTLEAIFAVAPPKPGLLSGAVLIGLVSGGWFGLGRQVWSRRLSVPLPTRDRGSAAA